MGQNEMKNGSKWGKIRLESLGTQMAPFLFYYILFISNL